MDKDHLIKKWLADDLGPEESEVFENLDETPFFKDIVDSASAFKASQFSGVDDYQKFKEQLKLPETKVKKLNWIRPLMRIASVFVMGLAMYYLFFHENLTKIDTKVGEKISVTLPDASSVTLNALSEMAYNENRWNQKREIKLFGEAFFDVAQGATFNVITPEGTVSVLGTEFNVRQRGSFFEVRCFEGTVKVKAEGHEEILEQGDSFRMLEGIVTLGENIYTVPQWTKNVSDFQRVEVSQVFEELERQYGVTVLLENVNKEQLFTGGFVHDSLENALKSITEPLDLEYTILPTKKVRVQPSEK